MAKTVVTGDIRKLTVGNTGRIFTVGTNVGTKTICKIEFDPNYLIEYGERFYYIFTKHNKTGKVSVWDTVIGFPVIEEFDENSNESFA